MANTRLCRDQHHDSTRKPPQTPKREDLRYSEKVRIGVTVIARAITTAPSQVSALVTGEHRSCSSPTGELLALVGSNVHTLL